MYIPYVHEPWNNLFIVRRLWNIHPMVQVAQEYWNIVSVDQSPFSAMVFLYFEQKLYGIFCITEKLRGISGMT